MVKLSIITINYNNVDGLQKTIESVINQKFRDFEYIIIDGGSIDSSMELINKSAKNINYWISEADNGIYHAMNKGIQKAHGDYCFFLNSGDYFVSPEVLESVFSENLTEYIIFGNLRICLNGKTVGKIKGKAVLTFLDLYNSNVVKHQSAFIKRSLFESFGLYNEDLKIVSDWEFFIKTLGLASVSYRFVDVDIAYFDNDGESNNAGIITEKERKQVLKTYVIPMMLTDYSNLESYNFLRPAFKYKLTNFALRLIAKLAKEYEKIRSK